MSVIRWAGVFSLFLQRAATTCHRSRRKSEKATDAGTSMYTQICTQDQCTVQTCDEPSVRKGSTEHRDSHYLTVFHHRSATVSHHVISSCLHQLFHPVLHLSAPIVSPGPTAVRRLSRFMVHYGQKCLFLRDIISYIVVKRRRVSLLLMRGCLKKILVCLFHGWFICGYNSSYNSFSTFTWRVVAVAWVYSFNPVSPNPLFQRVGHFARPQLRTRAAVAQMVEKVVQ